ncbi:MAG: GNAT family N-acetyltransferase [Rhodocyclaceae bacterium]
MNPSPALPSIRPARVTDVAALFKVRTSVRENALSTDELAQLGITPASIAQAIEHAACAWVATVDDEIVGFSMADLDSACLFAVFVLPHYEGRGIGSGLVEAGERALFESHPIAWLETAGNSRAARLYRHLGWGNERALDDGDIRLEKRRA